MKILLVGEVYSKNIGDPLLCETVRAVIHEAYPQAQILPLDLSGKTGFDSYHCPTVYSTHQRWYFRISCFFPKLCRLSPLYRAYQADESRHTQALSHLEELLQQHRFDAAVFAGGALFMDYFSAVICGITARLAEARIPVMFHACGMGPLDRGNIRLLQRSFCRKNVGWISLRDSFPRFSKLFHCRCPVEETFDTALLSSRYFPTSGDASSLGIGIMEGAQHYAFQKELISTVSRTQASWKLFTNGSPGDSQTAYRLADELSIPHDRICCPKTPEELIQIVSGFQKIISLRMHSQIAAMSCGVPSFGFVWDDKIVDLYQKLGLPENCAHMDTAPDLERILHKLSIPSERLQKIALDAGEHSKKSLLTGLSVILSREVSK